MTEPIRMLATRAIMPPLLDQGVNSSICHVGFDVESGHFGNQLSAEK
jgi:hypothetical protein